MDFRSDFLFFLFHKSEGKESQGLQKPQPEEFEDCNWLHLRTLCWKGLKMVRLYQSESIKVRIRVRTRVKV